MLVTDRQMTLTADCGAFANWSGTVSNNGLMVKILLEHIQHDITYCSCRKSMDWKCIEMRSAAV